MTNSLDIDLLPLYRRYGQEQTAVPGLYAPRKPRRTARSREADQVIVYLSLSGNATLPLDLQDQLVGELVKTYYDTNGSVTAALRITAETLNQSLLKRNLQSAGGQQMIGLLSLAVLRGDQFYLAQSGPVFAFYLSAGEAQELYDPALSGRGLGINQSTSLRYFHASLQAGDILLIAPQPPSNWNAQTLASLYGQSLETQQRRLLEQSADANAVLLNVKAGVGQVNLLPVRPVTAAPRSEPPAAAAAAISAALPRAAQPSPERPAEDQMEDLAREQAMLDQYQPLPELDDMPDSASPLASEAISVSSAARVEAAVPIAPEAAPPATAAPKQTAKREAQAGPGVFQRMGRALQRGLNRLLPEEMIASVPNSVLAFFALAIPLVIVAMAAAVYFQRGLAAQSEIAYNQAVEAVAQAQGQTEPLNRRNGLAAALNYLNAADAYRKLTETQTLRQAILADLDSLDLVRRLNYEPAIIGGLPLGTKISRIVGVDSDLFLLDSQSGKVIRAFYTNQGYQVDPAFQCGPGVPANVGALIDLSAWPVGNSPAASIVGMDANGMLLFCTPGDSPRPKKLPSPPTGDFADLKGFAFDLNDLYVLDPASNAVWVYWGGDLEGEPAFYFGEQVPQLQDVVDLAATNEELYLLHSDGRMTLCVTGALGEVTPNRCTDPAPFMDSRPGREGAVLAPAPEYSQLQYSAPPDPSLYLLDPANQAVDRFSLRNLAFQSRFVPVQSNLPPATSFLVEPVERMIFLAAGNQVYYTNLP